jgi:hypothetical protein
MIWRRSGRIGIALATGVQITTLRTQLSPILKKVGATSQTDLVRILASIPLMPPAIEDSRASAAKAQRIPEARNHPFVR